MMKSQQCEIIILMNQLKSKIKKMWEIISTSIMRITCQYEHLSLWLEFIMVMKIHYCEKIHHFVEVGSAHQVINLYFTKSGYIWPFWYFPGCVGGRGKSRLKTILAETEIRAELGNFHVGYVSVT